jgi:hypothetical protein
MPITDKELISKSKKLIDGCITSLHKIASIEVEQNQNQKKVHVFLWNTKILDKQNAPKMMKVGCEVDDMKVLNSIHGYPDLYNVKIGSEKVIFKWS